MPWIFCSEHISKKGNRYWLHFSEVDRSRPDYMQSARAITVPWFFTELFAPLCLGMKFLSGVHLQNLTRYWVHFFLWWTAYGQEVQSQRARLWLITYSWFYVDYPYNFKIYFHHVRLYQLLALNAIIMLILFFSSLQNEACFI